MTKTEKMVRIRFATLFGPVPACVWYASISTVFARKLAVTVESVVSTVLDNIWDDLRQTELRDSRKTSTLVCDGRVTALNSSILAHTHNVIRGLD